MKRVIVVAEVAEGPGDPHVRDLLARLVREVTWLGAEVVEGRTYDVRDHDAPVLPPVVLPARRYDGETTGPQDVERLDGQMARVLSLMADGRQRTPEEIEKGTGDRWASAGARLRDLRKAKFGGWRVERESCGGGVFVYRLLPPLPPAEDQGALFDE